MAADSCHKQGMAKFSLALNFANGAVAPYLAKWGCAPSGHPAPRPSEMDTAGASPYAYDTPCWRIVCHRLPRRTSIGHIRRPRSLHRQQSIQVCPAAAVSARTADVSYRRALGCYAPPDPSSKGACPLASPISWRCTSAN